ncbi:MAG: serine/threonine protein kinase [Oleiphilaceae bacterium]|jgi:serine/threonine protein kinase
MRHYILKEKLGQGGFAEVFKVENDDGCTFAKKIFSPSKQIIDAVGEEQLKKRFSREVRSQSKLNHQNVVPILDIDLISEPPFFIMPLASDTLSDELKVDSTLGGNPKKALFDILAGLEAVHEAGLHHRDLKPANVLKYEENEGESYYAISDFGLISGGDGDSSTLTGSNAKGGTQDYAAPELMKDFKRATHFADIYSFGAILHDIFSDGQSRIPYTELSVPDPDISLVVQRCTKSLPARRYKNVAELREDLFKVLDDKVLTFTSDQEKVVVDLLLSQSTLDHDHWDKVFTQLDENEYKNLSNANILRSIDEVHIECLAKDSPELIASLIFYFCDYIRNHSFDFDYCDVLATRAKALYKEADLASKANLALAILELGVSHNRWYVEWRFIEMAGSTISDELASRIILEIEVTEFNFVHFIERLKKSIGVSSSRLHRILRENFKFDK